MNATHLNKLTRKLMRRKNTPGLAMAITQNDQTIHAQGYGCRNLKNQQPMTPDTLMGIGSITKSFTAFAVLILEERGKLSLDDSVAKYLPQAPFKSRPAITIKHLLSHSSGIPALDAGALSFPYTFGEFKHIYPASTREDFMAHLADAEDFIIHQPGEAFFYNNDMYTCLGFIIEQLSGCSFIDFVQQEILTPLQMHRAVLTAQAYQADPDNNRMTGYLPDTKAGAGVVMESAMPMDGHLHAPGGLSVSMNEMLHYAQCLLNRGVYKGQRLLTEASIDKLFTGLISMPYGWSEDPQYGLGWSIDQPSAETPYTVIHHSGGMGTSIAQLLLVPELNLGIVATENGPTNIAPLVARSALALAIDQAPEDLLEDYKIISAIDAICGTYKTAYNLYSLTISQQGGILKLDGEIDDGPISFPLLARDIEKLDFAPYSLRSDNKAKIQFMRDDQGRVAYVSYDRYLYRRQ